MAYFGLHWVPHAEASIKVSEADSVELQALSQLVRKGGQEEATKLYNNFYVSYESVYAEIEKTQAYMQSWKDYLDSKLPALSNEEAEQVQRAAFAWLHGTSDFHELHNCLSETGQALLPDYYQFLLAKNVRENAEQNVAEILQRMSHTRDVAILWEFEAEKSELALTKLKKEEKEEGKKKAEFNKTTALSVNKLKKLNRQRMSATSYRLGAAKSKGGLLEAEDADAVLAALSRVELAVGPQKLNPKKSHQKEVLNNLLSRNVVPERGFF